MLQSSQMASSRGNQQVVANGSCGIHVVYQMPIVKANTAYGPAEVGHNELQQLNKYSLNG